MQPKKTVKSSIHWHFLRNRLFLLTKMHFQKEGQKIRAWVDPPHHSGNARKKTFFFIEAFPKRLNKMSYATLIMPGWHMETIKLGIRGRGIQSHG